MKIDCKSAKRLLKYKCYEYYHIIADELDDDDMLLIKLICIEEKNRHFERIVNLTRSHTENTYSFTEEGMKHCKKYKDKY